MANALKEVVTPMPKLVFIVLEDDVIKDLGEKDGLPHLYGRCIEWLYHEFRKMVSGHNDALPTKCQLEPYLVWVLPSRHMNYANDARRELFADCIENVIEVHDKKTMALAIKQGWDQYDPSIYLYDSQRYSASGLDRLWRAFDRTVWYASITAAKLENKKIAEQAAQRSAAIAGSSQPTRRPYRPFGGRGRGGYFANKRKFSKFGKEHTRKKLPDPDQ